jgi:hypothetical protein
MEYNPVTNEIIVSKDRLEKYNIETVIAGFLHEVVHSTTVNAYKNPITMEEKMFKSFIDEIFLKYKATADFKSQGLNNPLEFIAELMTNKSFQNNIKNTATLWDKIVDYIRSLIGLPNNSAYNKIINEITQVIKDNNYEGGINEVLYQTRAERNYYDISSIEKRQSLVVSSIKDAIEESIRKYDFLIKKLKDPSRLAKYSDSLKNIFKKIESFDENQEWLAIATFVGELTRNISSLKTNFNKVDLKASDIEKTVDLYDKYLTSHSLITEISDFISKAYVADNFPISREDVINLQEELANATKDYNILKANIKNMKEKFTVNLLNNRKYASEILNRWKNKLQKQHFELGITENQLSWVSRQMNTTYKDEIDADVKENANSLVNNVDHDITTLTGWFVSGISTNSKLVKIMQNVVNTVRENIINRNRTKDFELRPLFDNFIKERGNKSPSEMYANMLEYDSEGNAYLKGDYTLEFREIYEKQIKDYHLLKETTKAKYGVNSKEAQTFYENSEFKKWTDNNTVTLTDELGEEYKRPIDKWKNDLSKLSEAEREAILEFREITKTTKKQTFGIQSLLSKSLFGGFYYSLPAVTKSNLERVLEKQVAGSIKDKFHDLTKIRPDDLGYETIKTDLAGKPIYDVKIHYRGKLEPNQQSLDLFSLYRLEHRNGVNFEEKHEAEANITTLVEIAKNKEYYNHTSTRIPFLNVTIKRNKEAKIKGQDSNTYKRLVSLMETNLYDILHKDAGSFGKLDTNKIVGVLNGWTAKLGMWINEVAASVNVLNGKSQLFLESISGTAYTVKSLAKSEKIYFQHIKDNIKDLSNPVKLSYTNQLIEMFDTFGTISVSAQQAFLKNTAAKANLDANSLQFLQASGEHWLQSVLTMSILDGAKVMDINSNFLDKEGKVTTEENAASLLDMLVKDETGKVVLNSNVVYTTKTLGIKYNEGGKEVINTLLKTKIFQTMGNYDSNMQPEAMRHAKFKLVMLYRKFFFEMGIHRFRGIENVDKQSDELFEEEKYYSEGEQEYIEGFYTTTLRFIIPIIKSLNFKLASTNWKKLSTYEKKNIQKTIAEVAATAALLPAITMLLKALKGDDDKDEKFIWYLMLVTRRLQSELASYRSVSEQYKILNSPIPSMRIVQNTTNLISSLAQPWNWNERDSKDKLKIARDFKRLTPILNSTTTTYKQKYQYMLYMID